MVFPPNWLNERQSPSAPRNVLVLAELDGARGRALPLIVDAILHHLVNIHHLERLGFGRAAEVLRAQLPTDPRAQSADLGEVLASEYIDHHTEFTVPIKRLRWKDDRNMPLRGDDLIGFHRSEERLALLKGEAKSRASLHRAVVREAIQQLEENSGRPNPHSLAFIGHQLLDEGRDEEGLFFFDLLAGKLGAHELEHFVFTLSGNDPLNHLVPYAQGETVRKLVGVMVDDHPGFVLAVFQGAHGRYARPA